MTVSSRLGLLVIGVVACRDTPTPSAGDRERAELVTALTSDDPVVRGKAGFTFGLRCCNQNPALVARREYNCGKYQAFLEAEHDVRALDAGGFLENCTVPLTTTALVRFCREQPCSLRTRRGLAGWLERARPTAAHVEALLLLARGLEHPELRSTEDGGLVIAIGVALSTFGEADLAPLVDALTSSDRGVQLAALQGLTALAHLGPLELPAALPALDKLGAAAQPHRVPTGSEREGAKALAESARYAAELIRRGPEKSVEQSVAELLESPRRIRALGVRKFACRVAQVPQRLEETIAGDPERAQEAREALALYKERCR